jgi:amidohydrolase
MKTIKIALLLLILIFQANEGSNSCKAQSGGGSNLPQSAENNWEKIDTLCRQVEDSVISWRRRIHQNPELGNREFLTSRLIAEHLRRLGLEVHTGIAHTGVVGILRGSSAGPVLALRADMDALPVKELADVPFASKAKTSYNGQEVPVMHACGHDAHTSILMGTAEVLSKLKDELKGTVKFIFQPAEDSKPENESGGAELMIREGVLENPGVNAIIGLHVTPYPASTLRYKSAGLFAAVDNFYITVKGKQTHGALPWTGIDAVTVSAQVITGLQTIISRQIDLTDAPAFITVGMIAGGSQVNILCGEVTMKGTIRTFSPQTRKNIQDRIRNTAVKIAESAGASAEVSFAEGVPVVYNDQKITETMGQVLDKVGINTGVYPAVPITVGDDFSFYTKHIPGFYFLLGVAPDGADPYKIINHSPFFVVDDKALLKGVEAMSHIAADYLGLNNNR